MSANRERRARGGRAAGLVSWPITSISSLVSCKTTVLRILNKSKDIDTSFESYQEVFLLLCIQKFTKPVVPSKTYSTVPLKRPFIILGVPKYNDSRPLPRQTTLCGLLLLAINTHRTGISIQGRQDCSELCEVGVMMSS
jgi:hypothetical protein